MAATTNKTEGRRRPGKRLIVVIILLILANIAAWLFHGQIDLTKDKRYTITDATRNMLKHLDRPVEVLVFLDGDDLPAPFLRLSNSTGELLRQFRDISDNKVTYKVIDPLGKDTAALDLLRRYRMSGIPVTVSAGKKGSAQKMIFPWALVTIKGSNEPATAYPVFLQETNTLNLNRQTLLKSEILLEYNLANGIHQLSRKERPAIAYITGHGELFDAHIGAALMALAQQYTLDTFNLRQNTVIPSRFKSIIINAPVQAFDEKDKFKIDQYIMNGGNVLWSLNMVSGNLDSLRSGHFNAMPVELNLGDLLFSYGVRVNSNLVEDAADHIFIPLQASNGKAEPTMFPWIYFPVLNAAGDHPVVKNLNGVLTRFLSSIDTNSNDAAIHKTVLLSSSKYSKAEATPLPVILESAMVTLNPAAFPQQNLIGAVLLEGTFHSPYANRRPLDVAQMIDSLKLTVKPQGVRPGKMVVTGDADILANEYSGEGGPPSDMGVFAFDPAVKFDNKSFLLNCMEYMNDDENLLEARNKRFDSRILDPSIVEQERSTWQFINIGIPVVAILIFGSAFFFIRKRKYA